MLLKLNKYNINTHGVYKPHEFGDPLGGDIYKVGTMNKNMSKQASDDIRKFRFSEVGGD